MRLGIFGGTFDPIHQGHLRSAEEVQDIFRLDQVYFVPCRVPPHRQQAPGASPAERLDMIRLAIGPNASFIASDVEMGRAGKSYSIDTVRYFVESISKADSLYLILGYDAFDLLPSWKEWRMLLELCDVVVTSRPGAGDRLTLEEIPVAVRKAFCYHAVVNGFMNEVGRSILFARLTDMAISGSQIRKLRREERSIRYLVPDSVQSYIESCGLYRESIEC